MVDKEHNNLFHWSYSFDKHTKQLIKHELQNECKALCHQYKSAKLLANAGNHYAPIHSWWLLIGATFEEGVHELNDWLSFWHFWIKQRGGLMVHVSTSYRNFLCLSFSFVHLKL
jgi:hypothetical protein